MTEFKEYYWDQGIPKGLGAPQGELSYRIVIDPYRKRISLEEYHSKKFKRLIYDSSLFDVRHLTERAQLGWKRDLLEETQDEATYLVKDRDDRIVLIEKHKNEHGVIKSCEIFSPHFIKLFDQLIKRRAEGDTFDGVILQDITGKQIIEKRYSLNAEGEFDELLQDTRSFPLAK